MNASWFTFATVAPGYEARKGRMLRRVITREHARRRPCRQPFFWSGDRLPWEEGMPDADEDELDDLEKLRPAIREDCADVPRPCPFCSCRHNTYLDVSERTPGIDYRQGWRPPWEVDPRRSCVLDMIEEAGGAVNERVTAQALGYFTRKGAKKVLHLALAKLASEGHVRADEDSED